MLFFFIEFPTVLYSPIRLHCDGLCRRLRHMHLHVPDHAVFGIRPCRSMLSNLWVYDCLYNLGKILRS